MIEVKRTQNRFIINGHANDTHIEKSERTTQACAAVTALTHTLLYGILDNQPDVEYEFQAGWFWLKTENLDEKSLYLIDVILNGLYALSCAYEECINID